MNQAKSEQTLTRPSDAELRTIITDPNGAETLVRWADRIGKGLKDSGLTTSQIRALFGEVRQIQAEWTIHRSKALRRLILLKPKMAYRARKERGKAVGDLVSVLQPALDLVVKAKPKTPSEDNPNNQDDNYQRFAEFFEAILAYHKAYGGD
ncbi:MAG: type III-A CRISPR-associated protein Csm2 [Ardenticatenia bacterium]|jgi:CRISPR-associated protein Csm2|nr:MAG: type III-A CRISPR-associated protein Csm2 [Ardenticatenia bacterium]